MQIDGRPVPNIKGVSETFWREARAGRLVFQRCPACAAPVFPARLMCPLCANQALQWEASCGKGRIYSYTVVRQNRQPYFVRKTPYVVALVDVDPGFRMMSNIVGLEPEEVYVGMPVTVGFEVLTDDIALPFFTPEEVGRS